MIVIMASDAAIQASRPAGSTVQLTVTDSFLTVQGPAWYGDLTYTVTAGCVPQSTHAAAAVEIEGYSPQKCVLKSQAQPTTRRTPQTPNFLLPWRLLPLSAVHASSQRSL